MTKMKKLLCLLALTIAVLSTQTGRVYATENSDVQQTEAANEQQTEEVNEQQVEGQEATAQGFVAVEDFADLLSEEEEAAVANALSDLSEKTGWHLFALCIDDAKGMTAQEYADDYVDTHAFELDGVCYLIDMDNREVYVCTTGMAIRYLTDDRIETLLDYGFDGCSNGDYAAAFLDMIKETGRFYNAGIYADQYNQDYENGHYGQRDYYNKTTVAERVRMGAFFGIPAFIIGFAIYYFAIIGKYRIKGPGYVYNYSAPGNSILHIENQYDNLISTNTTHRRIQTSSSSGGSHSSSGGHRSTTHHSSGGGHHGGGGRHF